MRQCDVMLTPSTKSETPEVLLRESGPPALVLSTKQSMSMPLCCVESFTFGRSC